MTRTVAKWSERIARSALALGFVMVLQAHAATVTAGGVALTQNAGSSTCSYSQANESVTGDWTFTCGPGPATVTISPSINGTVCATYGSMSEDVSGNWTIAGCVSAAPTISLDAPVSSSSTYPSNVPFTLKATATPPAGRTIASVEFFHDGISIHTGALSGSQYVWDWAPPTGTYQVTVRATDNTGAVIETNPAVQMVFAPTVGAATIYYIHPDQLGTPREITRASDNQIVWRWDNTEPFGNSQPDENPSGLGTFDYSVRLPGQYFDTETGTNYNYFRDYDPSIGRYVESDPVGLLAGLNTFGYVDAKPLAGIDRLGLWGLFGQGGLGASGHVGLIGLNFNCGVIGSLGSDTRKCGYCTVCVRLGPGLFAGAGGVLGGGVHSGDASNLSGWSFGAGFDVGAGEGIGGSGAIGISGEPFPGQTGDFTSVGGLKGHGGLGFGISIGLEACRTITTCKEPSCQTGK